MDCPINCNVGLVLLDERDQKLLNFLNTKEKKILPDTTFQFETNSELLLS